MTKDAKRKYLFSKKTLIHLIVPLIIEQVLAVAVGMADTIMVASVGESAVSAVSLVDAVIILMINIFAALATGGAVAVGHHIGKNESENASKVGEQLIVFVTLFSIIITLIMYLGKNFILNVVFGSIDPLVAQYANTYLLIVTASIPFIAIYNSGAALFRAMGNSKITMKTSLIMNLINVLGNALLIYGFKMGVAGVAIPTLISRAVAAIIIIFLIRDPHLIINFKLSLKFRINWDVIKNILQIGVPNGVEGSMFQLGKIMVLSVVSGFGTAAITANAVANTITAFQFLPASAIGLASITIISQCVGAGDYEQARYYTRLLNKYAYIALIITNGFIISTASYILKIYNLSPETLVLARRLIIFYGINASIIWPLAFTLPNTLRAAKDVKYAMIVSISSMWVMRIGLGILFAVYFDLGVFGVWLSMVCDWYVRAIFFIHRYRGSKWEKGILPDKLGD